MNNSVTHGGKNDCSKIISGLRKPLYGKSSAKLNNACAYSDASSLSIMEFCCAWFLDEKQTRKKHTNKIDKSLNVERLDLFDFRCFTKQSWIQFAANFTSEMFYFIIIALNVKLLHVIVWLKKKLFEKYSDNCRLKVEIQKYKKITFGIQCNQYSVVRIQ